VLKSDSRQFVAAQKKNDDTKDDPILLLSDDDEAGKKLTMPKKKGEFFSTPWKHYEVFIVLFMICFCKLFYVFL
jgi:hypothetical protein